MFSSLVALLCMTGPVFHDPASLQACTKGLEAAGIQTGVSRQVDLAEQFARSYVEKRADETIGKEGITASAFIYALAVKRELILRTRKLPFVHQAYLRSSLTAHSIGVGWNF
jgi:hypothetical protein